MVDSKGGTRLEKSSKLLYRFCGSQLVFALVYNVRQGCAFPTIFGCAETLSSKVTIPSQIDYQTERSQHQASSARRSVEALIPIHSWVQRQTELDLTEASFRDGCGANEVTRYIQGHR